MNTIELREQMRLAGEDETVTTEAREPYHNTKVARGLEDPVITKVDTAPHVRRKLYYRQFQRALEVTDKKTRLTKLENIVERLIRDATLGCNESTRILFDRAYGKPKQDLEITGTEGFTGIRLEFVSPSSDEPRKIEAIETTHTVEDG